MDIVVVEQPDGSFKSSPFHVRFGKLKLLKSARKEVAITVNGVQSPDVKLLLGQAGEAFFYREAQEEDDLAPENLSMENNHEAASANAAAATATAG